MLYLEARFVFLLQKASGVQGLQMVLVKKVCIFFGFFLNPPQKKGGQKVSPPQQEYVKCYRKLNPVFPVRPRSFASRKWNQAFPILDMRRTEKLMCQFFAQV